MGEIYLLLVSISKDILEKTCPLLFTHKSMVSYILTVYQGKQQRLSSVHTHTLGHTYMHMGTHTHTGAHTCTQAHTHGHMHMGAHPPTTK